MNRILLVDDDLELTQLLTEILTLEGFQVTVAEDGEEGLQRLAEQSFDLVLLDVMMPRLNGFAMLTNVMVREFKKNGGTLINNCRVEKVIVEDGAVTGVKTAKGTFYAPVVVSNAGLQPTVVKLVGEHHRRQQEDFSQEERIGHHQLFVNFAKAQNFH